MKTIVDILQKSDTTLAKLINQVKFSQDLEAVFRIALDADLAKHCQLASYKNSQLTITVANSSWATRLRYAIPDIIKRLRIQPEFKTITNIRYAITSPQMSMTKPKTTRAKISCNNEVLWQNTLAGLKKKAHP